MTMESNFHKSFGWMVGAVTHASESEEEFLSELTDDLRAIYQLMCKDRRKQGVNFSDQGHCIYKHLTSSMMNDIETISKRERQGKDTKLLKKTVTAKGKVLKMLTEHYSGEKKETSKEKELEGEPLKDVKPMVGE